MTKEEWDSNSEAQPKKPQYPFPLWNSATHHTSKDSIPNAPSLSLTSNGIPENKYSICEETGFRVCEIHEGLQVREDGMIRKPNGYNLKTREWNTGSVKACYQKTPRFYYKVTISISTKEDNTTSKRKDKRKDLYVHRLVAKAFVDFYSDDLQVDHIDGDSFNNNVNNLRYATRRQNQSNQSMHRNGKLPGTFYDKKSVKKWRAKCSHNNITIHLGSYDTEQEAHEAYTKYLEENNLS